MIQNITGLPGLMYNIDLRAISRFHELGARERIEQFSQRYALSLDHQTLLEWRQVAWVGHADLRIISPSVKLDDLSFYYGPIAVRQYFPAIP